jgi:hypothetical protein
MNGTAFTPKWIAKRGTRSFVFAHPEGGHSKRLQFMQSRRRDFFSGSLLQFKWMLHNIGEIKPLAKSSPNGWV